MSGQKLNLHDLVITLCLIISLHYINNNDKLYFYSTGQNAEQTQGPQISVPVFEQHRAVFWVCVFTVVG